MALLVDAVMLLGSAAILRGVPVHDAAAEAVEARRAAGARPDWRQEVHSFGRDLMAGLRFVMGQRLLVQLALQAGLWQFCYHAAMVVQILYATRTLGLSEQAVGLSYVAVGLGSVLGSLSGHRVSQRLGPGPAMLIGQAVTGLGWLAPVLCSPERVGQGGAVAAFVFLLLAFAVGATWIFVNFISLRQVVTPGPLLGRMTTTMRWLILLPAGPGALIGGWLGEHAGLWSALAFAGGTVLLGVAIAWRYGAVRQVMVLPQLADELADSHQVLLGAEAAPGHIPPPADGGQSMSATVPRPPGPAHGAAVSAAPAAPFSGPAA
jgi:MFS family permease